MSHELALEHGINYKHRDPCCLYYIIQSLDDRMHCWEGVKTFELFDGLVKRQANAFKLLHFQSFLLLIAAHMRLVEVTRCTLREGPFPWSFDRLVEFVHLVLHQILNIIVLLQEVGFSLLRWHLHLEEGVLDLLDQILVASDLALQIHVFIFQ